MIEVARSRAFLVKKDIFRNLMWYTMPDSNKQYPLTIERVKKIKALNQQGIKPEELEAVEVVSKKPVEVEPTYADVVGQISLKSLEKTSRKRRDMERGPQQQRQPQNRGNQPQQDNNRPQNRPPQGRDGRAPQQNKEGNRGNPQQRGNQQQQKPQQKREGQDNQRPNQQQRPPQQNRNEQRPQPKREGQGQRPPNQRGNQPQRPLQKQGNRPQPGPDQPADNKEEKNNN
jgi:hypothetical protein